MLEQRLSCYQLAYLLLLLESLELFQSSSLDFFSRPRLPIGDTSVDHICSDMLNLSLSPDKESTNSKVIIYDPKSPSEDKDYFKTLGFTFQEPKDFKTTKKTLFYMLHCPHELYDQVFQDNMNNLENVILLGNDLADYKDRSDLKNISKIIQESKQTEIPFPLVDFHSNVFTGSKWTMF